MTLRPEYSLGHSPYNPFLFATVGIARHDSPRQPGLEPDIPGDDVTVLSALTRLQVDPWHEARRLAELPPDVASTLLAATLGRLTDVSWATVDAATTARRLIALLPPAGLPDIPVTQEAAAAEQRSAARSASGGTTAAPATPGRMSWIGFAVVFVVVLAIVLYLKPSNELEPGKSQTSTTQ